MRVRPLDGRLARLVRRLTNGFADIADAVIAPSESIRTILVESGVTSPIRVIPTGIGLARMQSGDRTEMRARLGLGPQDFVVGHLGRLSTEKNLSYLGEAVAIFLARHPQARFIVAGHGDAETDLVERFAPAGVGRQVQLLDTFGGGDLASFYAALDIFAFASVSETQGLVVLEAMAAGTPVVALDGPGVRESIGACAGGTLMPADARPEAFADAFSAVLRLMPKERAQRRHAARAAAETFSIGAMGEAVESLYDDLIAAGCGDGGGARRVWEATMAGLAAEGGFSTIWSTRSARRFARTAPRAFRDRRDNVQGSRTSWPTARRGACCRRLGARASGLAPQPAVRRP